jgi:parallel beta-helix repeat protein
LACGAVLTQDTTLANDVGPCPGNGLTLAASNIHLNLNGHSVTGSHQATPSSAEQVGILMNNDSNDTVFNGTVRYFDAGVAVNGGSGNTIRNVYAHDNISRDTLVAGGVVSHVSVSPDQTTCDYGDGITTDNSSDNRIEGNRVDHNGPFSGISLVDASSNNVVQGNQAADNNVVNRTTTGQGTLCGAGALTAGSGPGSNGPMTSGRPVQDIGVRVEGPGATANTVEDNQVTDSALYGISIHSYPCNVTHGMNATANVGNSILHNVVTGTGDATHALDPTASGIGILRQGPTTAVCVSNGNTISGNTSTANWEHGIFLGGPDSVPATLGTNATNVVNDNRVDNNHVDGVHVSLGALNNALFNNQGQGNGGFDGADYNPSCDNNSWQHNRFGTVNQPCVASGPGSSGVVKP